MSYSRPDESEQKMAGVIDVALEAASIIDRYFRACHFLTESASNTDDYEEAAHTKQS